MIGPYLGSIIGNHDLEAWVDLCVSAQLRARVIFLSRKAGRV